jgi:hypothetical protein
MQAEVVEMKKLFAIALLSTGVAFAFPMQAYYTGHSHRVTTISGQNGMSCEYKVRTLEGKDQFFWKTFANSVSCPYNIQVE